MKKEYRIKKNEEFQRIIKEGKSKAGKYFVVYSTDALENHDRIGISVGKRNGNAVIRNKIKRQVRMMLQEICGFNTGKDYIVIVRKYYNPSNYDNNKKDLSAVYNSVYNRQGQTFVKEN
ncbi:MAG: ribonuclease P protein component [Erysipelotrichia bacterium]|nr:ribonuclease P protein component [Erysipelotrichia bacterium]